MKDRRYYSNYAETHDIDCFFKHGDKAYHFASNGQPIPAFIKSGRNKEIQRLLKTLSLEKMIIKEARIRNKNLRRLIVEGRVGENVPEEEINNAVISDEDVSNYSSSFKEMARQGFISMDMSVDGRLYVVASPVDVEVRKEILILLPDVGELCVEIIDEEDERHDDGNDNGNNGGNDGNSGGGEIKCYEVFKKLGTVREKALLRDYLEETVETEMAEVVATVE